MRDQLKDLAGNPVLPSNFSSDEKLDAKSVMFEILETLDDGGRQQRIANCRAIESVFEAGFAPEGGGKSTGID